MGQPVAGFVLILYNVCFMSTPNQLSDMGEPLAFPRPRIISPFQVDERIRAIKYPSVEAYTKPGEPEGVDVDRMDASIDMLGTFNSRRNLRSKHAPAVESNLNLMINSLAVAAIELPTAEERLKLFEEIVTPFVTPLRNHSVWGPLLASLGDMASINANEIIRTRSAAQDLVREVEELSRSEPDLYYEIIKWGAEQDREERAAEALDSRRRMGRPGRMLKINRDRASSSAFGRLIAVDAGNGSLGHQLGLEIQKGTFDAQIAKDLLVFGETADLSSLDPTVQRDFTKVRCLVGLSEQLAGPGVDKDVAKDRFIAAEPYWPADFRQIFCAYRQQLYDDFYLYIAGNAARLETDGAVPNGDALNGVSAFLVAARRFELAATGTQLASRVALGSQIEGAAPALPRRRGRQARRRQRAEVEEVETPEDEPTVNYQLLYIDRQGVIHPSDSGRLQEMIESYIKENRGNGDLREDLERSIEALKTINLREGQSPSLNKLEGDRIQLVLNERGTVAERLRIHEYKPFSMKGLSLRTKLAKNTRIMVVIPEIANSFGAPSICVLDIVRKDQLRRFFTGRGMGTSGTK